MRLLLSGFLSESLSGLALINFVEESNVLWFVISFWNLTINLYMCLARDPIFVTFE